MPRNSSNATAKRVRTAATRPTPDGKQLFLLKSEPDDFSIDDLAQAGQHAGWEGVRNAQAANILRSMRVGDWALFYHSSCKDKGVVGIAEIVREAYPDATAWDPTSKYFDPKTDQEKPKVPCCLLQFVWSACSAEGACHQDHPVVVECVDIGIFKQASTNTCL